MLKSIIVSNNSDLDDDVYIMISTKYEIFQNIKENFPIVLKYFY